MESWQIKLEQSRSLLETVKRDKAAVQSAEDVEKLRKMFEESRKLAREAGQERRDLEAARLDELMAEHERQEKVAGDRERASQAFRMERPQLRPYAPVDPSMGPMSERIRPDQMRMLVSDRMVAAIPDLQRAALGSNTNSAGGYLVVPAYLQDLFAETRRQGNALRSYGWLNVHPVESNQIFIPRGSGTAAVQWTTENTQKTSVDQSYTQLSISINTLAGISKQSKQLAMDSSPTVLDLSTRELGSLIGNAEEQAFISGSGTGQPKGILNTTGLAQSVSTSDSAAGAVLANANSQTNVIDAMLTAVVAIETQYFAPPTGILMHPRRLGWLLKGKDSSGNYLFNRNGTFRAPNFEPAVRTVTNVPMGMNTPPYDLFGLPIGTSANIPTNANYGSTGASDQDVIIVANWNEAHVFQRQDVTMDTSDVAGTSWENNQVWIRGEERLGFTCERYPTAFACVFGKGLNGTTNV